jgi:hypothetical protein
MVRGDATTPSSAVSADCCALEEASAISSPPEEGCGVGFSDSAGVEDCVGVAIVSADLVLLKEKCWARKARIDVAGITRVLIKHSGVIHPMGAVPPGDHANRTKQWASWVNSPWNSWTRFGALHGAEWEH